MNRRTMAAFCVVVLLLTVCLPIQAAYAQEPLSGGDKMPQGESLPIAVHTVLMDDAELLFLPIGADPATLLLPETAYALYGLRGILMCAIGWRYDELDMHTPGRQTLTGDIILPDGYVFEADPLTVSAPVLVYDPAGEPTERIASCLYADGPNVIIPLGTAGDELAGYFTHLWPEAYLTTEAGDSFFCPVTLDLDCIDPNKAGTYYPVALELPVGVEMSDVFAYYALSVHVVPVDEVDLGAVSLYQSGYLVQWLYEAQSPVLWASVDGEEWNPVQTQLDNALLHHYGRFLQDHEGVTGLELFFANLPLGHVYKFQVQYDGNRFSKVLVLDLMNNSLPRISGEQGGDRNGGDREENLPPGGDMTVPPPENAGNDLPTTTEPPTNNTNPTPPTTTAPPGDSDTPAPEPEKSPEGDASPKSEWAADGGSKSTAPPIQPTPAPSDASLKPSPAAPFGYAEDNEEAAPVIQQTIETPTPAPSAAHGAISGTHEPFSYSDSWLPTLMVGLIGLASAIIFLLWRKKGGGEHDA